jgi:hypothetical protein
MLATLRNNYWRGNLSFATRRRRIAQRGSGNMAALEFSEQIPRIHNLY